MRKEKPKKKKIPKKKSKADVKGLPPIEAKEPEEKKEKKPKEPKIKEEKVKKEKKPQIKKEKVKKEKKEPKIKEEKKGKKSKPIKIKHPDVLPKLSKAPAKKSKPKKEKKPKEPKPKKPEKIKVKKGEEQELAKGKIVKVKEKGKTNGKVLETYDIESDEAKIKVEIRKEDQGIIYSIFVPEIGIATASLLDEIRNELVAVTTISMKEILDPSAFRGIKKRFMNKATTLLKKRLPRIKPEMHEFLIGKLMQDMLGLGEIEFLVSDPNLEEVVISSSKESIRIYHKKYGWLATNLKIAKEEEVVNYSNIIARRVGRQITVLTPLLDAHLLTGDRVNAVLYPISTKGNTITIRKFARDPFTIIDLINSKTCDLEIAAILWLAIEYEMNVLISGGTASGKTTFLNACMPFIPPNHRIISVEDTRELMLPDFLYWAPLVTRTANPEGKGEVSMLDLLINSLRMRPDRIVLGEMRRQREAEVLFEAMHTGHSVYATVHADTAAETISRLTNPPINVPPNLLKAVNLNVVMFRDRRKGIRRISQIAEFEAGQDKADATILFRWSPERDEMTKHSESMRFFEEISRNTGMSPSELNKNLEVKKEILSWLVKNKIRDLNDFGRVMNFYYVNRETLISAVKKNDVKRILQK
jgi:flagellar protein FlaI